MQIIIPSDVFPPTGKGGAAWSSHALALALLGRGHMVTAVVPARGRPGVSPYDALGVPALRVGYRAPSIPIVQNYFRHERLWPRLADAIVVASAGRPDVIHAQHVQAAPAAVLAGRRLGAPVVVTVRDHWPWDYFATGLHGDRLPHPAASRASLATDLPARLGPLRGALAMPAIPYMLAHLRRRAAFLARADAVIACSGYIARRLAGIVAPERLHVLPHMVDFAAVDWVVAASAETQVEGPLLLFAGKLEPNKGAGLLPAIFRELCDLGAPPFTLVVAGDGALRGGLARDLEALGVRVRFLDWAGHDELLRLMARCDLLLFPSAWGEPLSRVLLEASSVGAPILAMPTGGTPDIIADGVNGALAATPRAFAARLRELLHNPAEARRLGSTARDLARARYAVSALVPRYEELYAGLRRP
ncbi:glycosyltransferase family 4 protein [Chloroflexales bacterium ZM16-3]|nr:glycosyltransferase family 4 protein [Chloroflexales bacterium ZM16-3]